ncbi:MAG: 3-hydroxyacyl-ACP dehydratase FabZ [Firmicutes bacterium]|nr:3-hydroxyacyl-ACP dehydratase FabZ [Bacillota bacterium]
MPHRDSMLLVDEVTEMEPEKEIRTRFHVDPGREIFQGHFPGDPVLPGVYTVEIMAQTADILILSCQRYAGKVPLFVGTDKVRFLHKIMPGDTLEVYARFAEEKREKAIVTCSAEVRCNGVLACTGDVTLAMR